MADKQVQLFKRVLKKLTALRKTLPKSERDILDAIVLRNSAEVAAHGMVTDAAANTAVFGRTAAPEVAAHGMVTDAAANTAVFGRTAAPEVAAHGMVTDAVTHDVAFGTALQAAGAIYLDADGAYTATVK
ncbi:MAG: hypothetical protein M1546_24260 [Chloroflexi bacterium]|nr:hypothetical protein [Chloroflexota bacterium]